MTPEKIRTIAKQAGAVIKIDLDMVTHEFEPDELAEFVRLVRKQTFDEAEQVCITTADPRAAPYSDGYNMGAIDCTKAIRKLK